MEGYNLCLKPKSVLKKSHITSKIEDGVDYSNPHYDTNALTHFVHQLGEVYLTLLEAIIKRKQFHQL